MLAPNSRRAATAPRPWVSTGWVLLGLLAALTGCWGAAAQQRSPPPPPVTVSKPIEREVRDYKDFTGGTAAEQSVAVRARVSGYLMEIPFKEGAEVKKGDVLFEIDARPYVAVLDQAVGQQQQAEANVKLAKANYERALRLSRQQNAITQQDLDTYAAQLGVNEAQVVVAKASVDAADLNVKFCKVESPIDGRVSRYLVTKGNLVTQDQTLLTTIVSQDPMYGYFDVDEQTMLDIQALIRAGKMPSARTSNDVPVLMGLANEKDFPHQGTINFVDNRVAQNTGTLQVRGIFANPLVHGSRVLSPGLFARFRIFMGDEHRALLVNERAIGTDQGQHFIYVVGEQDRVEYHNVELGQLHDGLRVVESGIGRDDRVIVRGLQRVQPGMKVQPKLIDMPPAIASARPAVTIKSGTAEPKSSASPAKKGD